MATAILNYFDDRITINPDICNSKPTLRNKRITVQTVLEFLGAGETVDEILYQYPSLEREDVTACLRFATHLMEQHYALKPVA